MTVGWNVVGEITCRPLIHIARFAGTGTLKSKGWTVKQASRTTARRLMQLNTCRLLILVIPCCTVCVRGCATTKLSSVFACTPCCWSQSYLTLSLSLSHSLCFCNSAIRTHDVNLLLCAPDVACKAALLASKMYAQSALYRDNNTSSEYWVSTRVCADVVVRVGVSGSKQL